ncbi:hypothetical protein AB1N83_006083 [Pleurotus pulmonarius]
MALAGAKVHGGGVETRLPFIRPSNPKVKRLRWIGREEQGALGTSKALKYVGSDSIIGAVHEARAWQDAFLPSKHLYPQQTIR